MTKAAYHQTSKAPLATEVDHARMAAILAKHQRPKVDIEVAPPVVQTPKAEPLEWEAPKPGGRGYYSLCHRYSVCSVTVAGHDFYETHKRASDGWCYYQIASGLKSFDEAEARAQADANGSVT